mgnify:CR=1 FL=1
MKNTATLKKISDHLNISISTVSRALKDHPDVSPETKKRVKELAELMDYEPNAFAVNLRKKHSNLFGIIVPEVSTFFYHAFIQAVEESARKKGYAVMILQSLNNAELEKENLRLCRHNHVAGIFVAISDQTTNLEPFKKIEALDIPLVFFDKVPAVDTFNKVCLADEAAGSLAAEKIIPAGKAKVLAIFGNPALSITVRRQKGFENTLKNKGPHIALYTAHAHSLEEAARVAHTQLATLGPNTAIFSMSDEIMCGVLKACNQLGLQIPTQVSLLTISNGFLPGLFNPVIDYVETNGYQLGKLSFDRMQEIMDGKTFVRENLLNCSYYPGGSLCFK